MGSSGNIGELIDFVKFTHEIRNIKRAIILEGDDRFENDAEHCYQMALVAWYLIESRDLTLDKYRCIGMAMVHDVLEVHAGDIIVFASDKDKAAQAKREKEAVKTLKKEWPEFTSLHELIEEYEKHDTPEGKFVYALDKLLPIINNYLYGGKTWKRNKVTLERIKQVKAGKIDISSEIAEYYQEILKLLEQKPEIFVDANRLGF